MKDDFKDFAEYIIKNYKQAKVVEVGIGPYTKVYQELKKEGMEVMATDIEAGTAIKDDVTKPNIDIYARAELIYSIRPPPELYTPIERIAALIGADLIIKPLSTDPKPNGELMNYKGTSFYLTKFPKIF